MSLLKAGGATEQQDGRETLDGIYAASFSPPSQQEVEQGTDACIISSASRWGRSLSPLPKIARGPALQPQRCNTSSTLARIAANRPRSEQRHRSSRNQQQHYCRRRAPAARESSSQRWRRSLSIAPNPKRSCDLSLSQTNPCADVKISGGTYSFATQRPDERCSDSTLA